MLSFSESVLETLYARKVAATAAFCGCIVLASLYVSFVSAPKTFLPGTIVTVEKGMSAGEAAEEFSRHAVVRSPRFLSLAIRLFGGTTGVKAGDYLFESRTNAFSVASRLISGGYGFSPEKITIPEGLSSGGIADLLSTQLIRFDRAAFLALGRPQEGYLFPETYFWRPTIDEADIVKNMRSTFDIRIKELSKEIEAFGKPLSDVVIMASILEEEAQPEKDMEDARKVAGILWKRIGIGMALQVDSAFRYSIGKTTATLTSADLETDSPYNTYTRPGLPPTAISNPGMAALLAAVTPIPTPYLYFLTGKDGAMHYAATLEEHVKTATNISGKKSPQRGVTAKRKVFVGLSGGVDSSVCAALLIDAGYDVTGVFIKAWHPDFLPCTWQEEKRDAMRVCAALRIPFLLCDAEAAYKKEVVDMMVNEYARGRTPNPDVMCNIHVKFGVFFDFAMKNGADLIATGHYAQAKDGTLRLSADTDKDQTYFLWGVTKEQLAKTLFPVGGMPKSRVRALAKKHGLHTFEKKDSQGLCFMGKVDVKEFLSHYIPARKGRVVDESGSALGTHDGAVFYTIGERHGFGIDAKAKGAAEKPYYVAAKDMKKNTIVVSHRKPQDNPEFAVKQVSLEKCNFTVLPAQGTAYRARVRYRQPLQECSFVSIDRIGRKACVEFLEPQQIAPGQSAVFYDGKACIGGGIIT